MKINTMVLGDYQVNCYLVSDEEGNGVVIDPGYEPERIRRRAEDLGIRVQAIFLTHGHFDHIGAVKALYEHWHCPVYLQPADLALPPYLTQGLLFYTEEYGQGDEISVGNLHFTVLETPGHTKGSVCLRCGDVLFTGDTLFAGSCGRTDLGGDWFQLQHSLIKLVSVKENLRVLPGHGESSTLETERRENPYIVIKGVSDEALSERP